uniref:Glucose-methanol-choline oxidoreductase N-terminal domain-containing protein n=1 Tax=Bionectria ochroleuca TaxID=29856 RepID=A0A8H7NMC7_BIOOC
MRSLGISSLLLALASFSQNVLGQRAPSTYTDSDTGIVFDTWTESGLTFGFALPTGALQTDASEYIGYLRCDTATKGTGYCALSLGGSMTNKLLLTTYPYEDEVLTSFQWATGYRPPGFYAGDAQLTQISSKIEDGYFEILYRCQNCLKWNHNGSQGSLSTTASTFLVGWAIHSVTPTGASCPTSISAGQHNSAGTITGTFSSNSVSEKYQEWTSLADKVVPGHCDDTPSTTSSIPGPTGTPVPTDAVYDYVVIGSGAGGLPAADRLSESGKKVLLIEKGPPSTGQWGGPAKSAWKPDWLAGTDLTRFDVPGLCNQIWVDSDGIACRDTDQMAGCLLGGGTAVNAGLWWKPSAEDWDYNFPDGWKSSDMSGAVERAFTKVPGTRRPSQDGIRYYDEGYKVLSDGVKSSGWSEFNPFTEPEKKNKTYTDAAFMFINGQRGGALATYLASASERDNFDLWTATQVKRIVRSGGHATGLEVEPYEGNGYEGTVQLTPGTGRVIVSAGAFGSARLLMRSGIGPQDQLEIVANSTTDGPLFISDDEWILLPVGHNLEDHTNTDTVVSHPSVKFYDFYAAYTDPIESDAQAYLDSRSGILAQAAPNIGPVMYDEIAGADGIVRSLQWTSRVEASFNIEDEYAITMSQYLGRGSKSRGRMTLASDLSTVVNEPPYLHDPEDIEAIITGLDNMREALSGVEGLTWLAPAANQTSREYVNALSKTSGRGANHWIGTNKLGTEDGRQGGDAVVDLDTKVWGTDNIFVVDASVIPGMVTPNIQSYIVSVSEKATERILALEPASGGSEGAQCGGIEWNGSHYCQDGLTCTRQDASISKCQ